MRFSRHLPIAACVFAVLAITGTAATAGPMQGANGHTASGSAMIEGDKVVLGPDFLFDGGPDVYVATKQGGEIHLLGKLQANAGAQSYALPTGGGADEILLFCKKYNVTLGKAAVE